MNIKVKTPPPLIGALPGELLTLQSSMRTAGDEQIRRIVAMVDSLSDRGALDGLLAPLRPRLAVLHPIRKPTLRRLLFVPIEPLIVPPTGWQRGELAIVRTALGPIGNLILDSLEDSAPRLQRRVAACAPGDEAEMLAIGALLWPQAAAVLRGSVAPVDWSAVSGLTSADFGAISRGLSALLSSATEVLTLSRQASAGRRVPEAPLVELLEAASRSGGACFGLMSVLLLARIPQPGIVLRAIRRVAEHSEDARLAAMADFALDHAVAGLHAAAEQSMRPETPLLTMAERLEQLHGQLRDIDQSPYAQRADRRRRITEIRRQIEQACRTRFAATLEHEVVQPMLEGGAGRAAPAELEARARELRRLGETGANFGDGGAYDDMLRRAADTLGRMPDGSDRLAMADRVRMVELLVDSDAAVDLLHRCAPD